MPHCSSEGKFQGFEDEMDIQIDSADATDDEVSIDLTLNRLCAGCGTEAATANLQILIPIEHDCPKENDEDLDHGFEIENGFDDATQIEDYTGKKGRGSRQVHMLGAQVSGTIKCVACDEEIELDGEESIRASEFEVESSH